LKKLVVIGAGGFAREVAWMIDEINAVKKKWDLIGFIDENPANHGKVINSIPVLGDFNYFSNKKITETVYSVCAVGSPRNKAALVKKASDCGLRFANLVHPSVKMSRCVEIGCGNIICAGTIITTNVVIRNHVGINPGCGIGHDVVINDNSTILWNVNLSGNVIVGTGSEIGTKTVVIQGITIGEWSVIGAGAVVVKDLPPFCTAVGVPARPIKIHNRNLHEE
jgi:sugar O-acyltransferase (sialic acid O-acetyltransferase NeuD family)